MSKYKLADISTRAPKDLDKEEVKLKTLDILKDLNELQNVLYAQQKHSLLIILQGMDASGKDGAIRKVFGTLNPQGVMVKSYKAPTAEELAHDFLWRIHHNTPAKGMIQIFNRSHYEDILITRVHKLIDDDMARKRMKSINHFERLLLEQNNTHVLKFYLHISPEEQADRLKERLEDPKKHWKYNEEDLKEAKYWDDYRKMYEECFEECNETPWTIVPADQNWYKEYTIASTVCNLLKTLKLEFPTLKTD